MTNPTHTLLLALDASPRCVQRLRFGRALAALLDAELCGMPVLEPCFEPLPLPTRDGVPPVPLLSEVDPEQLRRVRGQVERAYVPLRWIEPGPEAGSAAFVRQALCADWLLLGQHDAADAATHDVRADLVEVAVIGSGRPAFVLPYGGGTPEAVFETIVVGWKATREAARALAAALPLLRAAKRVHVLGPATDLEVDALRAQLRRHDVDARFEAFEPAPALAGELLLARAGQLGADLLVMGCYGHGRLRELALGGATRGVLRAMTLPVLMAH
jgi:nucleotide-binding universal stress UspA family protein